ncbi:MAG TPA: hypothetical protein ENI05_04380 [Porticoccus sp.]|nr:hypothetical protein [Porticoccus sp.]
MSSTTSLASYLCTRNGAYYFRRRLNYKLLRVSLKTRDASIAQQRAYILYRYTNELKRLDLQFPEINRLTKVHAERLYEDGLTGTTIVEPTPSAISRASLTPTHSPVVSINKSTTTTVANPLKIADSLDDAVRDLTRSAGVESKRKCREALTEFSLLNSDLHFHDIRFADAGNHLNNLLRLPKRRTDSNPYRKIPITEVVELNIPPEELMSATTINARMKLLRLLFEWSTEQEAYDGKNPFASSSLRLQNKPRERGRYDSDDINVILSSALFTDDDYRAGQHGRRSWWWLIMLGLFTSARVSELAQLTVNDVIEKEGVLCLNIHDEGDKSVKSPAGVRLCPIHPTLISLGFPEYLDSLHQKGLQYVIPYPNETANNAGQRCSKWYCGNYRIQHLPKDWPLQDKVYHSFINRAVKELQLDLHQLQEIVGHTPVSMGVTRVYAKGKFKLSTLFEFMSAFHYEGIDLSGLVDGWKGLSRD